jgi:hypothetical protein
MSDVIDFLESMGQDAQLRHGSQDEVKSALTTAEIAPELQSAILAKDQVRLETLLGQAPLCVVFFQATRKKTKATRLRKLRHGSRVRPLSTPGFEL